MLFKKNDHIDTYTVIFPHRESACAETYHVRNKDGKRKFLKRFKNRGASEIEIVKNLKHNNLCRVTDYTDDYLVTEFVSGETIDKKIARDGDFSVYDIKTIAKSVLKALQYLHGQSVAIIHNNVVPQNVLLDLSGGLENLKLTGLSKARLQNQSPEKPDLTALNPFYLAPERFKGFCCVQSDLYSVGVMLYYLIFGMLPCFFDTTGLSADKIDEKLTSERSKGLKIPNIDKFELDENLLNIISKALQNDISERFQSADEFIKALDGEIEVQPTSSKKDEETTDDQSAKSNRKGNGFADVAGMKDLKDMLQKSVINILKNTEKAKKYRLTIPNGMLLYGPPGCGKSFIAEKFAEETGYNYVYVKSSDLSSIYVHGSQEKIGELFDNARKNAPTILCFDEFDSLVPSRDNVHNASQSGEVNEFLSQLNNCGQDGVFVIASTNKPDRIDSAVLRRGRIDKIIYLPVPDLEARSAMFELHLANRPCDFGIDYQHLAHLTKNYVSSDIAYIVNDAAMRAAENDERITQKLLEKVISENPPSVKPDVLRRYEQMKQKLEGFANEPQRNRIGF